MQWALLISVMVMGFLGSWHCGVMCGPLSCNFRKNPDFLSYHVGRLLSYLLVCSLLFAGSQFLFFSESRWLRLAATLLTAGLLIIFGLSQLGIFQSKVLSFRYYKFQTGFFERHRAICKKFPVVLGLMTGLLPCSWLYSFLILSARMNTLTMAWAVIFAFWLTSLPAFFVFSGLMRHLVQNSPVSYRKISGIVLIIAGVLSLAGQWVDLLVV